MTNVAIIFSMLPLSLGLGQGGEQRAPMAIVSIGGLITSTVMTLYVVPVLYSLIEGVREFFRHRKSRAPKRTTKFSENGGREILPENA
jgi:HAE1 family hydrophobic/amphiphilic exporter-1